MAENLNNPSNALYIDSSTDQAVAVSTDNPMPCTNTINATIGAAGDSAGDNTVIGQLKQIATNTTPA